MMTKSEKSKVKERPVVVTTSYRGVFFGYAVDTSRETIFLRGARLCLYWTTDMMGFMGLAAYGPGKGCKLGPPADITLRGITAVLEVTPEAEKKWNS